MTEYELGSKLKSMYENAPKNEAVAMINLFGIRYANEINMNNISCKKIVIVAGIKESYQTEVRKGVNLAKYVKEK